MNKTDVIIRPIITERSTRDGALSKFTFVVALWANKLSIKKAVEDKFKVNVVGVATRIVKGKKHRVGVRRIEVEKSPFKKATVALKKGQKIDVFEVGGK